jgi:hypothetical protein
MTTPPGPESPSPRTLQQWLAQGEMLYAALQKECQAIELQLSELETRLAAKHAEVNRIAGMIGKPPVETSHRLSAQLITAYPPEQPPRSVNQLPRSLPGRIITREPVARAPLAREPVIREVVPPRV